jgi:gliding motility-associated-like protein
VGASSSVITGTYTITQADINTGSVTNSALATAKDPNNNDVTDTSGTSNDNNTATVTTLTQAPAVALIKTASVSGTGILGDVITYTFTVTNTGNTTLTNVVVTDPMVGLILTGSPIASLAVGASSSVITGTYTITQADINVGSVTNSALATAKDPNNNDVTDISGTTNTDNTATITTLTQAPAVALIKTASVSGTGILGDVITYTFTVTNTGNTTLTNVVVTDPMVGLTLTGSPIASLAVGGSSSVITGTYTITQADINVGSVTNSALAKAQNQKDQEVSDVSGSSNDDDEATVTKICTQTAQPILACYETANFDTATCSWVITGAPNTEIIRAPNSFCNADPDLLIDLQDLLPSTTPRNGTWTSTNNIAALRGSVLSPLDLPTGNYFFEYQLNDSNECPLTLEINIESDCGGIVLGCGSILIHNSFSPNGDAKNEVFTIDNIEDTLCYPDNTLQIYNRWGGIVYEINNYNNGTRSFTGISKGGSTIGGSEQLPTGTYFYVLNYTSVDGNGNPQIKSKNGYIHLAR